MTVHRLPLYCAAIGAALLAATAVDAQTAADPWATAPALPTACYSSQDQYAARNQAAVDALVAEFEKQSEINHKVAERPTNADPFELARRVQEAMMKDPQAAMKFMQLSGATDPAAAQAEARQSIEKTAKWEADEKALIERYKAAVQQAYAPFGAQFRALQRKVGGDEKSPFLPEIGTPAWAYAELDTIKRNEDKAYTALCPQWFGATGAMAAFLKRYKDYLVQERIPYEEKADAQKTASFTMMGTGAAGYKSTATIEAVEDYLKVAGRLYAERDDVPRCPGGKCSQ